MEEREIPREFLQRFLDQATRDGCGEAEAYRRLLEVLGISYRVPDGGAPDPA